MTAEGRGWVRASTALDSDYEAESRLLGDLEKTDEATRGKLLRALVRAGFKDSHSNAATTHAGQQGGDHGT